MAKKTAPFFGSGKNDLLKPSSARLDAETKDKVATGATKQQTYFGKKKVRVNRKSY